MSSSVITHQGIIDSIAQQLVRVKIINLSACSGCHAKGACTASDMEEKIIDIPTAKTNYKVGQIVTIASKLSTGFKALFLGYVLPFLIVLSTLIILTSLSIPETKAGLIALASLVPYYFALYIFRDKIKKEFTFEIVQ